MLNRYLAYKLVVLFTIMADNLWIGILKITGT